MRRTSKLTARLKPVIKKIPFARRAYQALRAGRTAAPPPLRLPALTINELKGMLTKSSTDDLEAFLLSGHKLVFPSVENPQVSVVLVLYNRAELTLACLRSLLSAQDLEVIVVDNCSTDHTEVLFRRVAGVKYIRNGTNKHFLLASNQGAAEAHGRYLLFLNSDTVVLPGAVAAVVDLLERQRDVGAAGGKLILPDGQLQEAGSVVWNDGTCLGYGRGDAPLFPQYMFRRDVDYCSGAFLLTRRELFEKLGGFDPEYQPAYYEETDYCLKLWEQGWRVVYEPRAVIRHFEFASSQADRQALELQTAHRAIFRRKRSATLAQQLPPSSENVLAARMRPRTQKRLLFLDERMPHVAAGAGYPRANEMIRAALAAGWFVTVFPAVHRDPGETWLSVYSDIPPETEVLAFPPYGPGTLERLLRERRGYYNAILISRPTTMRLVRPMLRRRPELFAGAKLIYDAEAIFTLRDELYGRLKGKPLKPAAVQKKLRQELSLAGGVGTISAVSPLEAEKFREQGFGDVHVIGHGTELYQQTPGFRQRSTLLFVGAIHADHGPNPDAVFWFIDHVMPHLKKSGLTAPFVVAGTNHSERLNYDKRPDVTVLGSRPDLLPVYNDARIFIAPTRFSAGIPLKVVEAAARGVPVVATSLIARQLGWSDGADLLVADTPEAFAAKCRELYSDESLWLKLRKNALARVAAEFSREALKESMQRLLA